MVSMFRSQRKQSLCPPFFLRPVTTCALMSGIIVLMICLTLNTFLVLPSSNRDDVLRDSIRHDQAVPVTADIPQTRAENQQHNNDGRIPVVMTDEEKETWKKKMDGWAYEPKNVNYFWKKMGDRPFQREFYSRLGHGKFNRILDVGARDYNHVCKDLINNNNNNSTSVEYIQMEPFPPTDRSTMNNDGLLECFMGEVKQKYPNMVSSFDLVIDFGVFGWGAVQTHFDDSNVKEYIDSVLWLLKDGGCWTLKTDKGWVSDETVFFDKHILPYFEMRDFDNHAYESGHSIKKGQFKFYFFYKK